MPEKTTRETNVLVKANSLEIIGDYVGAIRVIYEGLRTDSQNAALLKKR
ncbi:MAG TPA: hypothetical protein VKK79_07605 [Candidatus Lokiarchaeia archaeon]|nr:hypothetical protein [Candidatus Lokiarchaeia archaeon]